MSDTPQVRILLPAGTKSTELDRFYMLFWRHIKDTKRQKILAFWRQIAVPFFTYSYDTYKCADLRFVGLIDKLESTRFTLKGSVLTTLLTDAIRKEELSYAYSLYYHFGAIFTVSCIHLEDTKWALELAQEYINSSHTDDEKKAKLQIVLGFLVNTKLLLLAHSKALNTQQQ